MTTITKSFLETKTMTKRNLLKSLNNRDRLIDNLVTPILDLLLFVFVLGGAMGQVVEVRYVDYIVPGTFLMCAAQCSTAVAASISSDLQKGIVDRYRSMPISISSFLNGHVIESVIRTIVSLILMLVVALVIGFRPQTTLVNGLLVIALLLLFSFTITWVSAVYGLLIKGPEGVGSLTIFVLGFSYLSSALLPTNTFPKIIKLFAENQPVTPVVEAVRRLLLSQPVEGNYLKAVYWCLGLSAVFIILANRLFNKKVYQ
ncbi:ABC transporter permease [Enterococcus sp. 669A]|uniref:Transport permease protein n=1 Tax=Candidatus Enterococcus moelleringii TaxID=2815325 RepID=A0ABS3LDN4_9ENTE|nr:ABC transporter permease [Enterococcus sp. 669A]MBO1306856.1 ABC transporter permease [Enterococcus sp. 669A]